MLVGQPHQGDGRDLLDAPKVEDGLADLLAGGQPGLAEPHAEDAPARAQQGRGAPGAPEDLAVDLPLVVAVPGGDLGGTEVEALDVGVAVGAPRAWDGEAAPDAQGFELVCIVGLYIGDLHGPLLPGDGGEEAAALLDAEVLDDGLAGVACAAAQLAIDDDRGGHVDALGAGGVAQVGDLVDGVMLALAGGDGGQQGGRQEQGGRGAAA